MNQRQTGSMGDELTNAALIGLIGMFGIALVLRAAGSVTAFLTGLPQPDAAPAAGLAVKFSTTSSMMSANCRFAMTGSRSIVPKKCVRGAVVAAAGVERTRVVAPESAAFCALGGVPSG